MSPEEQPQGCPSPALRNFPMATLKRWCPQHSLLSDFCWPVCFFSECHCQQSIHSYSFLRAYSVPGRFKVWRDIQPWSPRDGRNLVPASVEIAALSRLAPTLPSSHHPDLGLTHQVALPLPEHLALTFTQLCVSYHWLWLRCHLCVLSSAVLDKAALALSLNTILFQSRSKSLYNLLYSLHHLLSCLLRGVLLLLLFFFLTHHLL